MKKNYVTKLFSRAAFFFLFCPLISQSQDVYTVESIPYQVYEASLPLEFTIDDIYSDILSLPFNFNYFGNDYNELLISTNGYIDFRSELAGMNSPYSFSSTIPDAGFPVKNSILGCYHDMDNYYNSFDGNITWSVTGDAPYRKAVFLYNNQPHFGNICNTTKLSTFQIIIYETLNYIDVQVTQKDLCTEWQEGVAVIGVINNTGELGYAAPGRNTGAWEIAEGEGEGWRFKPEVEPLYRYIKCDTDTDGTETFDLAVVQADLSASAVFYITQEDAEQEVNPIAGTQYTNAVPFETSILYAAYNDEIIAVHLSMVDCSLAFDNDTVATLDEDLNNDGNLANDDTDGDGLPDFADNDDDGDLVLTAEEYVFSRSATNSILDTDNDGIPNYLDNDDDGDGVLTADEDYNHNGNSADDDTNENGIPDYLEAEVAMGVATNTLQQYITLYPNPADDILNIKNNTGKQIEDISIYAVNGMKVKQVTNTNIMNVANLQSGIYIVRVQVESQVLNYKFVKK